MFDIKAIIALKNIVLLEFPDKKKKKKSSCCETFWKVHAGARYDADLYLRDPSQTFTPRSTV